MSNQQQDRWKPVRGGSDNKRWEPQKLCATNPQYPAVIEGYFTNFTEMSGDDGPFMIVEIHYVKPDGSLGDKLDIAGGKGLENTMAKTKMYSMVKIEYKGKLPSKRKAGAYFNAWDVCVDETARPYNSLNPTASQATSQPTQQQTAGYSQPVNAPVSGPFTTTTANNIAATNTPPIWGNTNNAANTWTPPPVNTPPVQGGNWSPPPGDQSHAQNQSAGQNGQFGGQTVNWNPSDNDGLPF